MSAGNQVAVCSQSKTLSAANHALVRDVFFFGSANVVYLALSAILAFVLPRFLSVETYGYYRLFVLYVGFSGVLHLGLLDGLLIRWASEPKTLLGSETVPSLAFLVGILTAILLPGLVICGVLARGLWPWLLLCVAVSALVYNVSALGQYALQASKRFSTLSVYAVSVPALFLAFVFALRFIGHLSLLPLLSAYVIANAAAALWVWLALHPHIRWYLPRQSQIWRCGALGIRVGWSVLIANVFMNLTLAMDRIVISSRLSIRDFAIYSFAANALAVVYTLILSIAQVLFPYLSDGMPNETRMRAYWLGQEFILVLWMLSLAAYFPLQSAVRFFLPNYLQSLDIIRILMLTTGLTAVIQILQGNYFRVALKQMRYLLGASVGMLSAVGLLLVASRTRDLNWVAAGMVGAIIVSWTTNEILLREVTGRRVGRAFRSFLLTALCCACFLTTSRISSVWTGFITYMAVAGALLAVFCRDSLRFLRSRSLLSTFKVQS